MYLLKFLLSPLVPKLLHELVVVPKFAVAVEVVAKLLVVVASLKVAKLVVVVASLKVVKLVAKCQCCYLTKH